MRTTALCAVSAAVLISSFIPARAIDGKHVNGRAVSVQWRGGLKDWGEMECHDWYSPWQGSINLFTIQNGRVSKTDTIYKRTQGYAMYPAFNISGTKVAFYRAAYGSTSSAACTAVNGGLRSICIIDYNGANLTKLCDIGPGDLMGDGGGGIDWPAGDWIYYIRPIDNGAFETGSNSWDIWKVNYRTKENVQVYKATGYCTYARRFQLDLAGKHLGSQSMEKYGCTGAGGGVGMNGVADFPPNADGSLNHVVGFCGCNVAISASGNYGNNFCGSHANLYINRVNYSTKSTTSSLNMTTDELKAWSGDDFELDVEGVRWACNSDKWVLQQCGYDHGDAISNGSNSVAGNWVDQAAIRLSNNPKTTFGGDGTPVQGTFVYGSEPGDMWIDGGVANKGKYEDENGAWQTVPGYDPSLADYVAAGGAVASQEYVPARGMLPNQLTASVDAAGTIRVDLASRDRTDVRIMDMQGKILYASTAAAALTIPAGTLKPGLYLITERSGSSMSISATLLVSR
jgi:hypothetical protein